MTSPRFCLKLCMWRQLVSRGVQSGGVSDQPTSPRDARRFSVWPTSARWRRTDNGLEHCRTQATHREAVLVDGRSGQRSAIFAQELDSRRLASSDGVARNSAGSEGPPVSTLDERFDGRGRSQYIADVRGRGRARLHPTMKIHPQKSALGPMVAVFRRGRRRRNGSGIECSGA